MKEILFVSIIIFVLVWGIWRMTKSIKQAWAMYEDADKLEEEIKKGEPFETIYPKFLNIHKMAFEKNTFSRVRELAKMIEVKYDVKVFQGR
jgi:hypothetical protein